MPQPDRQPKQKPASMQVVRGQTFVGQTFRIDGRRFERCSFTDCVLEVGGTEVGTLTGCSLSRTGMMLVGAAETTIQQLSVMYSDPGFREIVEDWFRDVREMFAADDAPEPSPPSGPFDA